MPKVSFSSKDQQEVQLGMQEGNVEVVNAVALIHQFPPNKKTGDQEDPTPKVRLTVKRLDKDLEPTGEEEELYWKAGSLEKFHPGIATGRDDDDPKDAGEELDTEGNCLYAVEETNKVNKKSRWSMMATSLEEKGFRPDIMGAGYLPDLIGMKMHVFTKTLAKDFWGGDFKGTKDPSAMLCDKIHHYPYETKGKAAGKGKPSATSKSATAGKTNGAAHGAANASAAPSASAPADEPAGIASDLLKMIASEMAGKTDIERKKLQTAVQMKLMQGSTKQPARIHKDILDNLRNDEWLMGQLAELSCVADTDEAGVITTVSFPDAA